MIDKFTEERRLGIETSKCCDRCEQNRKVVKFIAKTVRHKQFITKTYRLCFGCYDVKVGK